MQYKFESLINDYKKERSLVIDSVLKQYDKERCDNYFDSCSPWNTWIVEREDTDQPYLLLRQDKDSIALHPFFFHQDNKGAILSDEEASGLAVTVSLGSLDRIVPVSDNFIYPVYSDTLDVFNLNFQAAYSLYKEIYDSKIGLVEVNLNDEERRDAGYSLISSVSLLSVDMEDKWSLTTEEVIKLSMFKYSEFLNAYRDGTHLAHYGLKTLEIFTKIMDGLINECYWVQPKSG